SQRLRRGELFDIRTSDFFRHWSFVICPLASQVHGPNAFEKKRKGALHEPTDSGTGVSPVRTRRPTHGRDARATSLRADLEVRAPISRFMVPMTIPAVKSDALINAHG